MNPLVNVVSKRHNRHARANLVEFSFEEHPRIFPCFDSLCQPKALTRILYLPKEIDSFLQSKEKHSKAWIK